MASRRSYSEQPRRVVAATLVAAAVITGFAVAYLLSDVLFLLFVGVVLATALEPLIVAFQRRRIPQPVTVGAVYACVILVLTVVITIGSPYVVKQLRGLLSEVPRASQEAQQWLAAPGTFFGQRSPGESWLRSRPAKPLRNWSQR